MKIINNLKVIRTQRKIAQKQLAMDTGYDPRTSRRPLTAPYVRLSNDSKIQSDVRYFYL